MSKQITLLVTMEEGGHDTTEAVKQLRNFEDTLAKLKEHRGLIVQMPAQIDAGLS